MQNKQENIGFLESEKTTISLIDFIHHFSQKMIDSKTEEDIFKLLVKNLPHQIGIRDYIMFTLEEETNTWKKLISYGNTDFKSLEALNTDKSLRDQIGICSIKSKQGDTTNIKVCENNQTIVSLNSEIIVPVIIQDVVSALIIGRYANKKTLIEPHRKLWETVTSLASYRIVKLRENHDVEKLNFHLENLLEKKNADLGNIIDLLSSKNSELKYFNEKQKELIQELHHRVTNNLQTISSIIRLYKYGSQKDSVEILKEIYNRVQILSIIYQNIYKSMEKDCTDIASFLHDLTSYLKSTSDDTKVRFQIYSNLQCLNFNILISLGLFVAEVFYTWLEKAENYKIKEIEFNVLINKSENSNALILTIKDKEKVLMDDLIDIQSSENIRDIMISGLVDQLEGSIDQGFEEGNFIELQLKS